MVHVPDASGSRRTFIDCHVESGGSEVQCRRYSADPSAYHGYGADSSAHSFRFALNLTEIKILKLNAVGAWWDAGWAMVY